MALKDVFIQHPERRYIMFGGGGGVGKTTFSAAAAYWLASQGKKVLVFSVDPQASLTDIFKRDIFGKGPVKIMENLWAQEIDADSHIRTYQQEVRQKILDMYGLPAVPEEIENYIQAASAEPAMEESAIFDAVVDVVMQGDYDYYIYDLVPLGHALYYLSMAKVYDEWINKITKLREEMREYEEMVSRLRHEKESEQDQILQELLYIKNRINTSARDPHGQGEDGLLLCGDPGGRGHQRHAEGGAAVCAIRRANRWLRGQPRHPARVARTKYPGLLAPPNCHAGQASGRPANGLQ